MAGEEAFISKPPCDGDAGKAGVFGCFYVYFRVADVDSLFFRNGKVMKNAIKYVGRRLSMDGRGIAHDGVEKTGEMHRGELRYIRFVLVRGDGGTDPSFPKRGKESGDAVVGGV